MKRVLPKCFISYCHDDADNASITAFENEIEKITKNNFQILKDKSNIGVGGSISEHENEITLSNIIIILFTPKYKEKVQNRQGGVYREFSKIMGRYHDYQRALKSSKKVEAFTLIPILFSGTHEQSVVSDITDSMYLDFTRFRASPKVSNFTLSIHKDQLGEIRAQFENVSNSLDRNFLAEYDEWLKLLFIESRHEVLKKKYRFKKKEEILRELFVKTKSYEGVITGERCILIGRKGSGKSTIVDHFHRDNRDDYKTPIEIIVDNFDLSFLHTFLYSAEHSSDIDNVAKITNYFEAVWRIYVLQQCARTLVHEQLEGNNKVDLSDQIDLLSRHVYKEDTKWAQFVRVCTDVREYINRSILESSVGLNFLSGIADDVAIESIVKNVIGEQVLQVLKDAIQLCERKFIFALDGFDQRFEDNRSVSLQSSARDNEKQKKIEFEVAWLKGLLRTVLTFRSADDVMQDQCDFCITIPQDRFLEVRDHEREDYRFRSITSNLQWTAIELSILIRKRLEGLVNKYQTDPGLLPLDRLDEIMDCPELKIPLRIQMNLQGNVNTISIFKYLLRHTFWRPRDLMFYVAAILANQRTAKKRNGQIDEAIIKAIVSRTTYDVIETEFIKEYQNSLVNIRQILHQFEAKSIILNYSEIASIMRGHDFQTNGGTERLKSTLEKIEYLFKVGFLGLVLDSSQVRDSILCRDSFIFSDGDKKFLSLSESKKQDLSYVIHPIFVEYLMLDTNVGRVISYYTDDYLLRNDELIQ
ncbi:MAG: hypothetical protein NMNS01_24830 [Nitrosomonas sp.]|nr:MAG: hypothetical protein NMNS01_24830 [Nitrosomonas sp.]